jgi:hypothetical protein
MNLSPALPDFIDPVMVRVQRVKLNVTYVTMLSVMSPYSAVIYMQHSTMA